MSQPQHTYELRKEIGFGVELALSQLGEPHEIQIEDSAGAYDLKVITTTDPLASLRADSLWSEFNITPGVLTTVPAGVRKLAVEVTAINNADAPAPTVFHLPGFFRGAESARYYGVDQLTLPEPTVAGAFPLIHYDFADPSVLFQDLAMTIPVTANGQTVEAVMDKGSAGYHLDAPSVGAGPTLVEKPTYIASGLNGLSALGYDRTANGNFGQNIRTSKNDIAIANPIVHLVVAEWTNPGTGFTGLTAHFVEDSWQGQQTTARVIGTAGDSGASKQLAGYSIFAGWIENRDNGGSLRLNSVAGVGDSGVKVVGDFKVTPANLAVGGNQNGGAGTGGWHGSISEWVLWQGTKRPTLPAVEAYVTGRFGLTWL